MSIEQEILEWAEGRPDWQRDALRRLVRNPKLPDADLAELVDLCKAPYMNTELELQPVPLTAADLQGATSSGGPEVTLLEVANVENVNAISSPAPLTFSPRGLTVVYGPNGAGKSGYIRMLKQVCRARGQRPDVLPDIYDPGDHSAASASVRYQGDGVEATLDWELGTDGPAELRGISIFDHECASVYTDTKCEVAFLPAGLDLLRRLTDVMTAVRRRLDDEIDRVRAQEATLPVVPEATRAYDALSRLDEDDAKTRIEELAELEDRELDRLEALQRFLAEQDPASRAEELEDRANRIRVHTDRLENLLDSISDEAVRGLQDALTRQETARDALRLATAEAFEAEPLGGTGGEPWKVLWQAARGFWEEAGGSDRGFPPGEGEECLLCQQTLDTAAAERFRRFEQFVQSDVEQQAEEAETNVVETRDRLRNTLSPDREEFPASVRLSNDQLADSVTELMEGLLRRRDELLAANTPDSLNSLEDIDGQRVVEKLREIVDDLVSRSTDLRAAAEEDDRADLENERNELLARTRLAERSEDILREVDRRAEVAVLQAARGDTATTGVTRRNTELTKRYLTEELASNFTGLVNSLNLDHLPIHVAEAPGSVGTAYHRLELEAEIAEDEVQPQRILSRGEHRAVAIAAFLSEVATQDARSTIILDDPVSSLDHDRRDVVASELVDMADSRPVVIFTHDMAFALALQKYCDRSGVALSLSRLVRQGAKSGRVAEDLPWHGMNVKRRVGHLRSLHQQAAAAHRRGDQEDYERRAKEIYGFLREAWERGVEELLLNRAVERFSPEIQTLRLRNLAAISQEHMEQLEEGMTKSSRWLRGHDDAAPIDDPVPEPDEIEADIDALEEWRRDLNRLHEG